MGRDQLLVCDSSRPNVRVVRFTQPDMREHLYDAEDIAECSLFRELRKEAIDNLPADGTLILNLGLIDWFPTAFYRFLLRLNEQVRAANSRLLMCCLPPLAREAFDLMGGERTFTGQVFESEARATFAATNAAT